MVALVFITAVSIVVQPCAVELPLASELPQSVLLLTEAIAAAATNLTPLATSQSWRSGHRLTGWAGLGGCLNYVDSTVIPETAINSGRRCLFAA